MAEAVKVIVRCRPMNGREKGLNCKEVVDIDYRIAQCTLKNPNEKNAPPKNFTFDGAYGTDSTTEQIYADIGFELVEGVTEGYNGTIFAYGQTGCGKSFSMQGISDPATQRGIIPRAFDHIFETIAVSEGIKFLVHASYLEIYNEEVRDLLGKDVKQKLDLKEHPERGVYVQGLSMHPVKNVQDCARVMDKGWSNRAVGATLMNADSSRSHSIFSIHLERSETDDNGEDHIRGAKLNLVDLAGSERQGKTGATGARLKEATKINLSLSALGNVISALVDGKSKHIPYRDSKLTRLLQDSLGGNTKTLMVACLSPADNNYEETLSTLRYANRAKNIKNKPKINEDPKDALLREYKEEIEKLKAMLKGEIPMNAAALAGLESEAGGAKSRSRQQEAKVVAVPDEEIIEKERQRIKEEYEQEMSHMKTEYEQMKLSKEEMEKEMAKIRENYDSEMANVDSSAQNVVSPGQVTSTTVAGGTVAAITQAGAIKVEQDQKVILVRAPDGSTQQQVVNSEGQVVAVISNQQVLNESGQIVNAPRTQQVVKGADGELVPVTGDGDAGQGIVGEDGRPILAPIPVLQPVGSADAQSNAARIEVTSVSSAEVHQAYDEDDQQYIQMPNAQRAVHLATLKGVQQDGSLAPRSSPTGDPATAEAARQSDPANTQIEAIQRLQELQQAMVGGEQINNEEIKQKRKKKKRHIEERKAKLQNALAQMDGEEIMLDIYDNVQEEVKAKNKMLKKEKDKNEQLAREIVDIQSEFEFDRIDYLDTIRKQEQQMKYYQSLIDKIHPCLRRDCNYANLDKIKAMSSWDEETQKWTLPKMTIEKTKLPAAGIMPGAAQDPSYKRVNGEVQASVYDDLRSEDRYLEKLNQSSEQDMANNYFKSKRADKLLKDTQKDRHRAIGNGSPNGYMMNGGASAGRAAPSWQDDGGQTNGEDYPMRKPMRLESLQPSPLKSGKKKKNKYNTMDPL